MAFNYGNYGPPAAQWQGNSGFFTNQTVYDKVLPDMQHLVDKHWLQFPPMNPLWHG